MINKFSERVREIRKENNLLQKDLAKLLNSSQTTIAKWESGDREPDFDTLIFLSRHFKVSIDYLLGEED